MRRRFHSGPVSRTFSAILAGTALLVAAEVLTAQPATTPAAASALSRAELSLRARLGGLKSVQVMVRTGGEGGAGMFDKKSVRTQAEATLRHAGITISDGSADPGDDEGVLTVTVRTWKPAIRDNKNYIGLVGIELMRWGRTNAPAPVDMLIASWDAGPQLMAAEEALVQKSISEMLQPMLDRFTTEFGKANPK